ncbi:MAG: type II toxin-antitoxin system RelE/ParE family toxin [Candidatus Obscuribacterales bacterium]
MSDTEKQSKLEIELSPDAENNLILIEAYIIDEVDFSTADRLVDQILARCEDLAVMPRAGRTRDEIAPGVRSVTSGNYAIYYRINTDKVEILRVWHTSRDIAAIKNDLS